MNQSIFSSIYVNFLSFLAVLRLLLWWWGSSPNYVSFFSSWWSWFLQPSHLQLSPHFIPAWKHSQYFFRQLDFLQWQPFEWCSTSIFGMNARGFLSINDSIALFLYCSYISVLWHPTQLQVSSQVRPSLKQSQYSLRHLVFLQLHVVLLAPVLGLIADLSSSLERSYFFVADIGVLSESGIFSCSSVFWEI